MAPKWSPKVSGYSSKIDTFRDPVFYVDFMLNLAHFWLTFGPPWVPLVHFWLPLAPFCLTFGTLSLTFGALGSLLLTLGVDFLTFEVSWRPFSYFWVFLMKLLCKILFFEYCPENQIGGQPNRDIPKNGARILM